MSFKKILSTLVVASLMSLPASRVAADNNALVGGLIGGVIGGVIVNEANKSSQRRTTTSSTKRSTSSKRTSSNKKSSVSSATRNANREVQTSLNYFGFPAGSPDGVLGRKSRSAVSQYQAHLGYPVTGQLTQYERDFLVTSYQRALAGGAATNQMIAANPQGPRGLLTVYRDQLAGSVTAGGPQSVTQGNGTTVVVAPQTPMGLGATTTTVTTQAGLGTNGGANTIVGLPTFLGESADVSLASHCNQVSLMTNTNGGFTTLANMSDPMSALSEQFCLARTYAIAAGEDMAGRIKGVTPAQIAQQCEGMAPVLKEQIAALSLKPSEEVVRQVSGFVLSSGMAPAQLAGTAKVCLSVGYRTDNMDVALGSALLLVVLGEQPYGELLGHHLSQGFGTSTRTDLALAWYKMGTDAIERGQPAVFAPGQPERTALIHQATLQLGGGGGIAKESNTLPQPEKVALPMFQIEQ